ncbi:MAG: glycosyltransferase [Actinobacteria bacterium]|nr:glycosyltransferase [Actinomycetota bacterium]
MRIVHVANFYGPSSGGIKTTLHELGRGYLKYGHEFIYIVPGPRYIKEQTPFGLKISLPSFTLPASGGYQIIRSNKQLLNLLEFLNPDRIEVSDRFTLLKVGRWAKQHKKASLVFSHETLNGLVQKFLPFIPVSLRNKLVNWHNRKLASSFDTVIATTEFAAAEFVRIGTKNLRKVALGVDLIEFNPENRNYKLRKELLKESEFLLVHCGRMSPEKQPERSVQALAELVRRGVNARLVIIGGGPLWNKIRKQSMGLPIEMVGYIASRQKVAAYLAAADLAIAPGPLETFCLSALESLASGTPVVASKSSAVGEILNISSIRPAGAVAADDGIAFANEIIKLLNKGNLRKVARSQAEQFSWANTIDAMLDIHDAKKPMITTKRRLKAA